MNINEAVRHTQMLIQSGQAVMWSSPPGMGKSESALALFNRLKDEGAKNNESWGLGVVFAATQTPPDLIGYQFKGERTFPTIDPVTGEKVMKTISITDPSVPLWYISTEGKPAFMYDKFFLIIEEYGQGDGDVKRAIAEIFLNGGTAPWYLPPGSVRLGLTNTDARDGVTKDFDFCIARRTQIKIMPDIEGFLSHSDKPYIRQGRKWEVMPVTKIWAKANPQIVFEDKPKEQGPWCNPRSLCSADRYLQLSFEAQRAIGVVKPEVNPADMEVIAGTIGMAATTSYLPTMQFLTQLPTYEEVVQDPAGTEKPNRADLQMLMAYQLASLVQSKDLAPVLTYVQKLPKDMGVTFISALLRRDYKGMINERPMQAWINKNAALVSIIASLSQ